MGRIKHRNQLVSNNSGYSKVHIAVIKLSKSINTEFKEIFRLELNSGNLLGITLGTDSTSKDKCYGKIIADGELLQPIEIKAMKKSSKRSKQLNTYDKIPFKLSLSIEASLRSAGNVNLCIMYES